MRSLLLIAVLILPAIGVQAADRVWLGQARLFSNDAIGDGHDRWRTGSYAVSRIRGTKWDGSLPTGIGDLVEYRLRSEIIAPDNLQNPIIGTDRRYVGALSLGAVTHYQAGGNDVALGLDLVMTGPQTGLGAFQSAIHSALGMSATKVLGTQIPDAIYPTLNIELGRDLNLSSTGSARRVSFRPFVEAQLGVENYIRLGGDLTLGHAAKGAFQVRDSSTGHRVIAMKSDRAPGMTFVVGGDVAYVQSSQYLPAASGYTVQSPRIRLRAGVYREGETGSLFYGLTWLGKEFANQPTSQVVGSLSVRLKF